MRRPRRSRFTVTLSHPRLGGTIQKVILATDAESAERFYQRGGYTVLNVVKGDLVNRPAAPAEGAWTLDEAALREAIEFLGLKWEVKVKQTGHAGGRYGAHQLRPHGPGVAIRGSRAYGIERATGCHHYITVKSWLGAEQAGRTLWHELTHAMQAEREAYDKPTVRDQLLAWVTCEARGRGQSYRAKPIEVEAREFESFNDEKPLAR